jgi:hypothetical protein
MNQQNDLEILINAMSRINLDTENHIDLKKLYFDFEEYYTNDNNTLCIEDLVHDFSCYIEIELEFLHKKLYNP